MKQLSYFGLVLFILFLCSCKLNDNTLSKSGAIICKASNSYNKTITDSVIFTQDDIVWFNTSTKELKLKKSIKYSQIRNFNKFKFYLGADSLFTATLAIDIMSSIVDNLVMHLTDETFFIEDGYPNWIVNDERSKNKLLREKNWQIFLQKLKNEGKLND